MTDPPLRGLFVAANNPAVTCPDAGKVRRGLLREDLFTVVHDPFLSATARYADIVLPATTYLETEDFYRAYGTYWMQYGRAAVPPQGEAWSNLRLAQELARRMGLTDPVFRMSEPELLAALFDGAGGRVADTDLDALRSGRPMRYAAPEGQEFRTPSGRLEFYSEQLAAAGLAPMPDWQPDRARGTRRGALAAAPVDRARLFPGAHRLFRGRVPAPPRGAALLHPASRTRRRGAASPTAPGFGCSTSAARSVSCCGSATRCFRAWCSCRGSDPTARRWRARSICCAPTAIPISARARRTRARFSTSPRGEAGSVCGADERSAIRRYDEPRAECAAVFGLQTG